MTVDPMVIITLTISDGHHQFDSMAIISLTISGMHWRSLARWGHWPSSRHGWHSRRRRSGQGRRWSGGGCGSSRRSGRGSSGRGGGGGGVGGGSGRLRHCGGVVLCDEPGVVAVDKDVAEARGHLGDSKDEAGLARE